MIINGTFAMLKNTATGRFHPIVFQEHPMPGNSDAPVRCKSFGHHTSGFESREDAVADARKTAGEAGITRLQLDDDIQWDGQDMPAMVGFLRDDKLVFI